MNIFINEKLKKTLALKLIPHNWVSANLKAHIDGEQSPIMNSMIEVHLTSCARCQIAEKQIQSLGSQFQRFYSPPPRPELRSAIIASLHNSSASSAYTVRKLNPVYTALSITALILAVSAYAVLNMRGQASHQNVQRPEIASTLPKASSSALSIASSSSVEPAAKIPDPFLSHTEERKNSRLNHSTEPDKRKIKALNLNSPTNRYGSGSDSNPYRLVVAVSDIDTAASSLIQLTHKAGGSVTLDSSYNNVYGNSKDVYLIARIPFNNTSDFRMELRHLAAEPVIAPTFSTPASSSDPAILPYMNKGLPKVMISKEKIPEPSKAQTDVRPRMLISKEKVPFSEHPLPINTRQCLYFVIKLHASDSLRAPAAR